MRWLIAISMKQESSETQPWRSLHALVKSLITIISSLWMPTAFIYTEGNHNVIKVDGKGFANCATSPNSGILTSGQDKITLNTPGNKWYICGVTGHCDSGQKLKITVLPKSMLCGALSPAPEPAEPDFSWAPAPVATPGYLPEAATDSVPIQAPDSSVLLPWKPLIPFNPEAPAWPPAAGFPWVPVPAGAR